MTSASSVVESVIPQRARQMPHTRLRLPLLLAAAQAAGWMICAAAYQATGLQIAWTTIPLTFPLIAMALTVWGLTYRRARADAALAFALILSCSTLVLFLQYPALAAGRPMIDATLLRADAALGISGLGLAMWTAMHPALVSWLQSAYNSLGVLLAVALAILAARRDRHALWEFVTHYHVCLGLSVAVCALWPATEPWAAWSLPDFADEADAVLQIAGFHDGTMRTVDVSRPAGLVAMPSFHVAAAWMATWAVRRDRPALLAFILVSGLLTASTVLLGVHYAVDVVAGVALLATSVTVYELAARRGVRRLALAAHGNPGEPNSSHPQSDKEQHMCLLKDTNYVISRNSNGHAATPARIYVANAPNDADTPASSSIHAAGIAKPSAGRIAASYGSALADTNAVVRSVDVIP